MPDPNLKEITTPLSRELAEFVLIQKDLKTAHDAFTLWFDKYAGRKDRLDAEETLISQSLFRDSLVMFVGCFDGTAPVHLKKSDIYKSANGSLAFFEWLKDIRDSYAAHKFGAFRQCVAGILLNDAGGIAGVGHVNRIYAGLIVEARGDVLALIRTAGRYADKRIVALSHQLTENAMAMSPDELAALKPARTYDVPTHQVRTTRERFRHSPQLPGNDD